MHGLCHRIARILTGLATAGLSFAVEPIVSERYLLAQASPDAGRPSLVLQLEHRSQIAGAFSPDGRIILTGSSDGTATVWEAETGSQLRRLNGHSGAVNAVAILPDGRTGVTAGRDGSVLLWDLSSGRQLRSLLGHPTWVSDVAVSPSGTTLLSVGGMDGLAILWDIETGRELRRFQGHSSAIEAAAFSPSGDRVATGGRDSVGILWDVGTGREIRRLSAGAQVVSVDFSPDGARLATGTGDGSAVLWDVESGVSLHRLPDHVGSRVSVAFSSDGGTVLTSMAADGSAVLWDVETGAEVGRHRIAGGSVVSLSFAPTGMQALASLSSGDMVLWSLTTGDELLRLEGRSAWLTSATFLPDGSGLVSGRPNGTRIRWNLSQGAPEPLLWGGGRFVAVQDFSGDGRLAITGNSETVVSADAAVREYSHFAVVWEVQAGGERQRLLGHTGEIRAVAMSRDGRRAATGGLDSTAVVWDVETGQVVRRFRLAEPVGSVHLADDGTRLLVGPTCAGPCGAQSNSAVLWSVETGNELLSFEQPNSIFSTEYSSDGDLVLIGDSRGVTGVWNGRTGESHGVLSGHDGPVRSIALSPDGQTLITGSDDGAAIVWEAGRWAARARLESPRGIRAVDISPDGQLALTASADGALRLWRLEDGDLVATAVTFTDGSWAVVAPDGRFDSGDLEAVEGLTWVFNDDPLHGLPIEVFMRDYYEPRLLGRLLAGEDFPPIGPLAGRNRVQPEVRIAAANSDGASASVTVEVRQSQRSFRALMGQDSLLISSGAADLRVFRDGQVVAFHDGPIPLGPDGRALLTFDSLPLPRWGTSPDVALSAYVFSEAFVDQRGVTWEGGVKSRTVSTRVSRANAQVARRAYVVAIGVDTYDDPAWNLRFAAEDAVAMSATLSQALGENPTFAEVVTVPLVSASDPRIRTSARKDVIRAVFDLLAGKPVEANLYAQIPGAARIRKAGPDDLVIVSFSAHGYADTRGRFYLFPSDIGSDFGASMDPDKLDRLVSSDDLRDWLREVDAGHLALVIDACHAAAAVEGVDFKPGPMGSRGFGQLAYDKGMRVLAASQAADVAVENSLLRQGLLTYALVFDGIAAGQADRFPMDGEIRVGEWLVYGRERVPLLYDEVMEGQVSTFGRNEPVEASGEADPYFQTPALFDFTYRRAGILPIVLGRSPEF